VPYNRLAEYTGVLEQILSGLKLKKRAHEFAAIG
jgi:hypothetical protein